MAKNTKSNHRKGAVKDRDQIFNPKTGCYIKRNEKGQFMKVKKDGTPFKGVKKLKKKSSP
jgi:hypothetical protein